MWGWLKLLQRNKKKVYVCARDRTQKGVEVYKPPISMRVAMSPVTSVWNVTSAGEIANDSYMALVTAAQAALIHKGDKCYVNKEIPLIFDPSCNDADYRIISIKQFHQYYEVIFEGLL